MNGVKIRGMAMPECCRICPFLIQGKSKFLLFGVRLGSKCKLIPIRDLDGRFVDHQRVLIDAEEIKRGTRSRHCPLEKLTEEVEK